MRKTKIKFMSLLLAVMMIVGMLPTTAFATGEITTGNAKVTAPVAGQTPSFTATSDEPEKYSVKLLMWRDVEKNQDITSIDLTNPTSDYYNYTFKGGKEYAAVVEFTAVGDNTLSYSNSFTINGETTYWTGNGLKRCYKFTATGTGGGEGTVVNSATVADINITLPAGYTSNDIDDLGKDRMIKFTNTGTEILYISEPTLSGTNASDFSVRSFGYHGVTPGNTNTTVYAIEPKIGLAPGTYTATISCTDDNNKLSVPVTAKVTLTVSDHNWDTSKWEFNPLTHWHKCTDSGCSAKGDEATHNSDKVVGAENATFDTDGYTGDKYCSICDRKMETGKAIAAGKYIRESKATMTPAGIDNTISANDLVFTSLDTSKYTVGLYRVFDMTDTTLNTVGMGYPHDKKFISGHKYAIEFEFEAVDPYVYDTMHDTHSSTFKLNDADTMMSAATTHAGSPARRVELVAGGVSVATYDLTTSVNGGHGTISAGENGITEGTSKIITFTPDSGYEIDKVMVNGTETTVTGNTLTVTMDGNKNVVVTYKAIEYNITVTDGKATIGAGSEISKAAEGTTVTLTANAAPSGKVFDKWVVESGSVALADANSATTTFTMPASAVSVKATYKNAPHTHTYNQETVKPEALKNPAGCTNNAVYFKSCSCGAISTTDTFVAMNTALGHADGSDWKYDSTNHWHECSRCHDKKDEAAHTASDWIIDTPATATTAGTKHKECTVCHRVLETQTIPSTGTIEYNITVTDGKATIGAGSEISKAAEGTIVTLTANAAPSGKVFDEWEVVSGGITLADVNSATTTFIMPASAVSVKATYKNAPHTHTYNQETVKPEALKNPAGCTNNAVYFKSCSCGAISTTDTFVAMNTALGHADGSDWKYDSTNHWHECSRCHDKKDEAAHDYGSDNVCDTCGYDKTVPHTHNLTLVAAKAATCTTAGNSAYYTCDGCDKWFADAAGTVEITDKTSVKIPAPGHTAGTEWKSDDTNHWHECTVAGCGVIIESTKSAHTAGEWIVDTPATATTAGTKHKECTVCHRVLETQPIPSTGTELKIIAGDNQIYNKASGSDVTITCNGDFVKFTGIKVDGSVVDSSNYTAVSGSTVLTLKASYLDTLTAGSHTVTFVYTDGEANANLTIEAAGSGHTHSYGTEWKNNSDKHWHECSCGNKKDEAVHTASEWITDTGATATTDGAKHKECTVCGYVMETGTIPATGTGHTHNYGSDWKSDSTNHWKECSCGDKKDIAAHDFKWVVDKEATATKKGSKHEECKTCGYKRPAVEIPATGTTTAPTDTTKPNDTTKPGNTNGSENSPQTGDNSNIFLWFALLFVSVAGVTGITVYNKKKKEHAE